METNELSNITVTNSDKKEWSNIQIPLANKFSRRGNTLYALLSVPKSSVKRVLGKIHEKMPPTKIRSTLNKICPSILKFSFKKPEFSDYKVHFETGHKNGKNKKRNVHSVKKYVKSRMMRVLNDIHQSIKKGGKSIILNKLLETRIGKRVLKLIRKLQNTDYWKKLETIWKNEQEKMAEMLKSEEIKTQELGGTPVE